MAVELLALPVMAYAAASDIRSRTIPDGAAAALVLLALAAAVVQRSAAFALLARPAPALLLLLLAAWRGGMGGGDVKLFAALCLFFEPFQSVAALLLALAAAFAAAKIKRSESLPFAPFLCGGFLILFIGKELF